MVAANPNKQWSSRFGFLMASVGFAVGLGNIWRFPYITGENGGAAFVLVYLVCAFAIGVPIVIAEILVGRRGGAASVGSMKAVAKEAGLSRHWVGVGYLNLSAAFLIQVTYAVISGWVLWYFYEAIVTGFNGVNGASAKATYTAMVHNTSGMIFWMTTALLASGFIVFAGVKNGIEKAVSILIPMLFALLILLVIFNVFAGGFAQAVRWLFTPDFSKITPNVFLAALGQAFFSIGVGMAAMMTYGSYLPKTTRIVPSALIIVVADTLVALLAGLVIFPAVFANGLDPAAGPGLIFQTLPVAFANMPGGYFFGVLFFLLLSVAAITSMVGLLEALVSWLENHSNFSRHKATLLVLGSNIGLSSISVLGYTSLSGIQVFDKNINGASDYISNQILLPLAGLLVAIFVGWFVQQKIAASELDMRNQTLFRIWWFLLRWPVPVAVVVIFVIGMSG